MRYWAYLAGKLLAVFMAVLALYRLVSLFFPQHVATRYGQVRSLFLWDMTYTFCVFGTWLVGAGLLALTIWDQRRRCRTCLRKLVMPLAIGSWGNILTIGRPATEWICPFGHGTLRVDNLQITGKESPDWRPHEDDIWKELESSYHARK